MTGLNLQSNRISEVKTTYQDKYNLKRINGIKDKGVKINMLMRLLGRKNQQIKFLNRAWKLEKISVNELSLHCQELEEKLRLINLPNNVNKR